MSPRPSEATAVQDRRPGSATVGNERTNPFPGPRPFVEAEDRLFFGRERQLSDLVALLFAQRALLLHGPSGVGKSSLVQAGLVPRARARGFDFLPVARVRDRTDRLDEHRATNRYVHNILENWRGSGLDVPTSAATLADALGALPPADEPGRVAIFDQFEEIFVVHPESWKDRADLLLQVQAALDRDPLFHAVFVLRDDYLARLQPLTPLLRDRLSVRYQLRGLTPLEALDAVVKPFSAAGRSFAPGVAEDLVRALRAQPAIAPESGSYEGEDVEPVQLQIVCRTFFDRLPPGVSEIRAEDVARHADVDQALVGFYEQAVAAAAKRHPRAGEKTVRTWFERQLITPAHTRGIVFRDRRATAGLPNEVVDELERQRVVRSEPRGPATWYELTHDRLIDAVLSSNRRWFAARSRRVARLWAAVGVLGLLTGAVSLVLLQRARSLRARASNADQYQITVPGQPVVRRLTGRSGQQLAAVMAPDGFSGELRLVDGHGTVVGETSGTGPSPLALSVGLPADGDYRLEARAQGRATGDFRLVYGAETPKGRAAPLTPGEPVPGRLAAPDEENVYTLAGAPGSVAHLTMVGEGGMRAALFVTGPGGPAVADLDQGQGEADVAFVISQPGSYQVRASSLGRDEGAYRLDLELLDARGGTGRFTGTLDAQNRTDVIPVRSDTGGVLEVSYAAPQEADVTLLAADGRRLVDAFTKEGGFGPWPVAPSTPYLVTVEWNGNESPYSLDTRVAEPRPLVGGRADGELSRPQQLVAYRLDGAPGDVEVLVSPQGAFDPLVDVVQPDGTDLGVQDNAGVGEDEVFTLRLQEPGPYLVVVGSSSSKPVGRFKVVVQRR